MDRVPEAEELMEDEHRPKPTTLPRSINSLLSTAQKQLGQTFAGASSTSAAGRVKSVSNWRSVCRRRRSTDSMDRARCLRSRENVSPGMPSLRDASVGSGAPYP